MLDEFEAKKAIKLGYEVLKKNWKLLIGVLLAPYFVSFLVNLFFPVTEWMSKDGEFYDLSTVEVVNNILNTLVGTMIGLVFALGTIFIYLNVVRGNPIKFSMLFSKYRKIFSAILLSILYILIPILAVIFSAVIDFVMLSIIFIILYVYLCIRWIFAFILLVDKNLSPIQCLTQSWRMTEGNIMPILRLCLASFGALILGLIALIVGVIPATIVVTAAFYYMYDLYLRRFESRTPESQQA